MSKHIIEVTVKVRVEVITGMDELGEAKFALNRINTLTKENQIHSKPEIVGIDNLSYSDIKDVK